MEDQIMETQIKMIKALIATTKSALDISKIMCEHSDSDILTGDHIICGLVYRLMIPMSDKELAESIKVADEIFNDDDEDDIDDEEDIEIIQDEENNTLPTQVKTNSCNCEICMNIRISMLNFNNYTPNDEWGDRIKNSIIVACEKYNRYI